MIAATGESLACDDVELTSLGATRLIARGGLGSVEAVEGDASDAGRRLVVKRYHRPGLVDADSLRALVSWRRNLPTADRSRLDRIACWPLAAVTDRDELVGFVMQRVPEELTEHIRLPSGRGRPVLREAQYLLADGLHLRRLGMEEPPPQTRLRIVWSLAETAAFLHQHRVVIGDLSSRNVLWRTDAGVLLVDCDSVTLGGIGAPLPPTSTVDWDDPAQPDLVAASSDVYKLALLVLRIVSRHFQTRDPALADEQLDAAGRSLLRMSLDNNPAARPQAQAWERWAASRRAAAM